MVFLLKAAIALSILLGFYKLVLQEESFFSINRGYLLSGLVLTFVLPFVTLPELVDHQGIVEKVASGSTIMNTNEPSVETIYLLPDEVPNYEIKENADEVIPSNLSSDIGTMDWIGLLYFFGVIILSLNFFAQLLAIFLKVNGSKDRLRNNRCIILNQTDETEPSSFFNYVFISPSQYDKNTYEQILEHEKVHVQKYHSIDLLISELAIIILWFNPLVWLYRKELEKNIEYQTDASLLESKKVDSEDYQMNLLSIASHKKSNTLVSNYNQSLIKKRIIMMNKKKSNSHNYWKYTFIAPILFVTLLVLNQPIALYAQENESTSLIDVDRERENEYDEGYDEDLPPFLRAVRKGDYEMVEKMLKEGADVNMLVNGDGSALTLAIRHGHMKVARLLLENGADAELGTRSDGYPLWIAAQSGDLDLVTILVQHGADVNQSFPGDGSALIQASKNGDLMMLKALVDMGADVDMPVSGDGNPLIMASKGGYLKVVKFLVKEGADVNYEVAGDEVPLINASEQGHLEVVKYLVSAGADVNKVCKEKINGKIRVRTALKMATKNGHDEVIEYLKKNGATE